METAPDSDEPWLSHAAKRKTCASASSSEQAAAKRRRHEQNGVATHSDWTSRLPVEFWHRTFTLLPPKTLGCLLAVNKQFRRHLDPSLAGHDASQPCRDSPSVLPPLGPDAIWQASRRLFWPHMPGPLKGRSELEMWRLCCTRRCQFCGTRERSATGKTQDQWSRGPGAEGVSPVFPLFLVTCGRCLSEKTTKEVHLYLSPSVPSFLLAGLPMVFVTSELHVVPPQLLSNFTDPALSQVVKVFSSEQVMAIHAEFDGVKNLGHAATEEWVKGLEARGKRSLADASRWERWYLTRGVHEMRTSLQGQQSSPLKIKAPRCTSMLDSQAAVHESQNIGDDKPSTSIHGLIQIQAEAENVATGLDLCPVDQATFAQEDATKLKALRKALIEERAALLDPPFTLSELSYVPAYLAMIRIPAPLSEKAWETLKQHLLDYRAEWRERGTPTPSPSHTYSKDAADTRALAPPPPSTATVVKETETIGPPCNIIFGFADDIIRNKWKDGANLSKKEASPFAVEVLLYVRQRFYAEVAKNAAAASGSGCEESSDPRAGLQTQKLMLEHMKLIFETKIKKHTDRHGTNLFFCTGCSGNRKAFGLQAVVQHYAAKHTTALSAGNRVVHWQTEWPEMPIFESDLNRKTTKQLSEGSRSVALPHSRASPQNLRSGASDQAVGHAAQAADASRALPVPASTKPQATADPPQPPLSHPSVPQQSHGPQPVQAPGPFTSRKDKASRKSNSAATTDSLKHGQYAARLNCMARTCKETWRKIANLKYLTDPTKAYVLLYHIVASFEAKFSERASLSTFIDGLSNHRDMRPARSIKNLHCKACDPSHSSNAKPLTLPQLLKHFKMKHGGGTGNQPGSGSVDWRVDMIRSPERLAVPELQKGLGKHEASLQLIIDALPRPGQVKTHAQQMRPINGAESTLHDLSRATGFQYEPDTKTNPVKAEDPEGNGARATSKNANVAHDVVTYEYGERPDLLPARVVYGAADSPRRYPLQGGKICQARPSVPELRCADGEQHTLAASAPYARLHLGSFEILGSLESQMESERGRFAPRDALRHDARYSAQPRIVLGRVDRAGSRDYMEGRYGEPYPYSLPGYDGGMQSYYHELGPWGSPQVPSAMRPGALYHPYGAYPQAPPARSVQLADQYGMEARDRQGDYPPKRLVQRDEGGYHPRDPHAPALYPRRGSVVYSELGLPAAYAARPPSGMDYEEYDPRYPNTGPDGAAAASREARRCEAAWTQQE